MSHDLDDTIAAIASAPGGAMRGILRVSGPSVLTCVRQCFEEHDRACWNEIHVPTAIPGTLAAASPIGRIPCDLYFWPTRRSYTGQPTAELHTIGSAPLLDAALRAVCAAGARLAEPGEFTMRAFLAGRLDLTQAEAVLGVIDAGSRAELDAALAQLAGGLASPLSKLREQLLDLLAHLEAGLDFVDEDIQFISAEQLDRQLCEAASQIQSIAGQMESRGETTGDVRVVLVGWPNVGKSSLLNALAGDSAALVSHIAGTTRDYLCKRAKLQGLNCLLIDTAGVEPEQSADTIAAAAQTMTAEQSRQAHLQLLCLDSTRPLNDWERRQLASESARSRLLVLTKADESPAIDADVVVIATSSKTGAGLDELARAIRQRVAASTLHESNVVAGTAVRCRESLGQAAESLLRARAIVTSGAGEELVAAEVRVALNELGKVVGAVYTDDVLDRIFSRFCIGK
jgi:tRNA modification GTPase